MRILPGFIVLSLACLGVFLVTGLVILLTLKRGTRTIQESMGKIAELEKKVPPENDPEHVGERWSGIEANNAAEAAGAAKTTCPSCGAEYADGDAACPYCGRKS